MSKDQNEPDSTCDDPIPMFSAELGSYEILVQETLEVLDQQKLSERIWAGDSSVWKEDPEIQKKIRNRLGWLTVMGVMADEAEEMMAFARSVKDAGLSDVVLLGMGGSSLCPEVLRKTYGVATGFPRLSVLDTTDPASILKVERRLDLKRTLFLLASKSGETIEMRSLYRYFMGEIRAIGEGSSGDHFIAITDPGSPLALLAKKEQFRKVFLNPADIGGRYSALSYFGLVPAALIGVDLHDFLERVAEMVQGSASCVAAKKNHGIRLGAILGTLGKAGRDKLTFITSEAVASFGLWAEQLVAESTGKEGKGLIPIVGETIGVPEVHGDDRLFISLRVREDSDEGLDRQLMALQEAGHPVIRIVLRDRLDLAGEFFRWEMATAVAGSILEINPFDEPNVSESKANTAKVLTDFKSSGKLSLPALVGEEEGVGWVGTERGLGLKETLSIFLKHSDACDYVALMAYLSPSESHEALFQSLRSAIREQYHIATTLGYGPRFLHSTGQLHKGGAGNGLFLQITAPDKEDIFLPEAAYSFGVLKRAQALGDFYSLTGRELRVLEIRLGENTEEGLKRLIQSIGSSDRQL